MTVKSFLLATSFTLMTLVQSTSVNAHSHEDKLNEIKRLFESANIVNGPVLVDCRLSVGTDAKCFRITFKAQPSGYTPGPWCPRQATDGKEVSGIWFDNGKVVDADGEFMSKLATTYNDSKWQMVDPETGLIKVTDTRKKCAAAARPDVDEEYENYCVECLPEYMADDATVTYTIPLEPQPRWRGSDIRHSGAGVAFNGIRLDGPAPLDAILGAYTVAPFDDCGGHVNLVVGYHYHAATDCLTKTATASGDALVIGYAMDGYKIMAHKNTDGTKPDDLDRCYGHKTEGMDYHYHVGEAGTNANLGCLSAEFGCVSSDPEARCDATARRPRP